MVAIERSFPDFHTKSIMHRKHVGQARFVCALETFRTMQRRVEGWGVPSVAARLLEDQVTYLLG